MIETDLVIRLLVAKRDRFRVVRENYGKVVWDLAFKVNDQINLLKRWALMNETDLVIKLQVAIEIDFDY